MLADSVEEWADAISHLLDNPEARTAMAEAGLETYNSNLTTAAVARRLDPILRASMRPRRATPG
jgi:glycosyltransferase involved in cell wall biosynthesis